jgi:RNA polymerase sigma-70 factor (ECF subfamily)
MDAAEYNTCVKQWSDALYRFACKCTGNEADADDVVQACYEVLWQKREQVEPTKAKAFLFQVAYRQSIDNYRKRSRVSGIEDIEYGEVHVRQDNELKKVLDNALSRLDDQMRALVLLKDYEGYKYDEIGQITGLTEAQVKVYLHRARKILKSYLVSIETII